MTGAIMTEVRAILENYHTLLERQYVGDVDAIVSLLDFSTAVERAHLTERQAEALWLVYGEGKTQIDVGKEMGITRQVAMRHVEAAIDKITKEYGKEAR